MADITPDLRRRIIELDESDPDITIPQIAARLGTDRDTVEDVIVAHLVETGGSRLPRVRHHIDRLRAGSSFL